MKIFLDDEIGKQIDSIINSLHKYKDGEISQRMKEKGIHYKANYGTSIVWLKKISEKYIGNNELANRLWLRDVRETKILATLIAKPQNQFLNTVKNWLHEIETEELSEQLGVNFLSRIKELPKNAVDYLAMEGKFIHGSIWVALSVFLIKGGEITVDESAILLEKIKLFEKNSFYELKCKSRFLRSMCRSNNSNLILVKNIINENRENKKLLWLIEDVETEIDFLK